MTEAHVGHPDDATKEIVRRAMKAPWTGGEEAVDCGEDYEMPFIIRDVAGTIVLTIAEKYGPEMEELHTQLGERIVLAINAREADVWPTGKSWPGAKDPAGERRHALIFDAVKVCLNHGAPGLGEGIKSAIASAAALRVNHVLYVAPRGSDPVPPAAIDQHDHAGAEFTERRCDRFGSDQVAR